MLPQAAPALDEPGITTAAAEGRGFNRPRGRREVEIKQGFEAWAVVEIMGHKQLAGRVSEEPIAGVNMLRIDIPEAEGLPPRTVYHGGAAIYAIHPCSEEVARSAAASLRRRQGDPFPVYVPELAAARRALEAAAEVRQALTAPVEDEVGDEGGGLW